MLQQSQAALLAEVRQAGFAVNSNDIPYQTIWCPITERLTLEATVQCAHGHTNRFTLRSLRQMTQNQTLQQL